MIDQPSNAAEFTVSELSGALRRTIEDAFGYVRLRGEISGFRGPHSSGHCYFSLKDENARIDAIIWRGTYGRLRVKPQEGLEVVATGKITTFAGKSSYQIVIDSIEPAGIGALMALVEERKRKLAAEGLFAAERKRALPYLPRVIGVVTSPTGAVIRDILHRLEDRFPRRVLVWPARVQGETSGREVAAGVRGFNAFGPAGPIPRPDVIIVARGGGSIEDLWGFNDEDLVRAVAESVIPVISAVGHETDWTLVDFAADMRAPTPTGAAEIAVPVRSELVATVNDLARRREEAMARRMERLRADLRSAARALPTPDAILAAKRQRLDLAAARLPAALRAAARVSETKLSQAARRLERASPRIAVARARSRLDAIGERPRNALATLAARARPRLTDLGGRLVFVFEAGLRERRARLDVLARQAHALSHEATLSRGFAIVLDAAGAPVRDRAALSAGERVSLRFRDGAIGARIEGGGEEPETSAGRDAPSRPVRRPRKTSGEAVAGQGTLFDP
ncbi:MAG: exodeoxyribonuclease VII large subunit [Salinarimonadaceae bacterium]|nr:MAG: exodeoxyribonuclease VII large subunit [Salinarimonadaceae bacterium]